MNVPLEALNINGAGTGAAAPGALTVAAGGTATYRGAITAQTDSTINANGGTLTLTGGINKNGVNLTLGGTAAGGTINIRTAGITGAAANSDLIVQSTTVNEDIANTYNGQTFIRSTNGAGLGVLNVGVANGLPTANGRSAVTMDDSGLGSSVLNIGGTVLNPAGANQSIASLVGAASSQVTFGANTLTIGFGTAPDTNGTANANFAGVISGTGGITKDETSTQILSGANTYTGATLVSGGTLQAGVSDAGGLGATTNGAFGNKSAVTVNANAILDIAGFNVGIGSLAGGGASSLVQSSGGAGTLTTGGDGTSTKFSGVIQNGTGTLSLIKVGVGTQTLSGANSYTGTTTVNGGTLLAGIADGAGIGGTGPGAFGTNSAVTVSAPGTLDIGGFNVGIGSLAGAGTVQNSTATAATLTTGGDGTNTNFSGVLQDSTTAGGKLSLFKTGAGNQTLSGTNTYTGLTTIFNGTLTLAGGSAIQDPSVGTPTAGAILIAPNALGAGTLALTSSETIGTLSDAGAVGPTTVALNGNTLTLGVANVAGGNTAFAGTITGIGSVVKNSADAFTLTGNTSTYSGGTTLNGGRLNINNSSTGGPVGGPPTAGPVGVGTLTINASNNAAPGGVTIGTTTASGLGQSRTISNAVTLNAGFNVAGTAVVPLPVGGVAPASTVDGVAFSGAVTLGAANVTINTQGGFLDLTGKIGQATAGNGLTFTGNTFTQIGSGAATDTANTYTGLTRVSSGYVSLDKGGAGVAISGPLQIDAGALVQGTSRVGANGNPNAANNQIAPTVNVLVNGTLDLAGLNQTIATLTGAGTIRLDDSVYNGAAATAAGTLTVNAGTFNGAIVDSGTANGKGALVKTTGGTLTLNGASTYTGGTTLNAGTLAVGNTKGLGSGNLTVNNGTLMTAGGPLIVDIGNGNININGGTVVALVGGTTPGVNHDQFKTTGTAGFNSVAGTLALVQQNGYLLAPGDKVNLAIATGGVNGGSVNGTPVPNSHITGLAAFSNTPLLVPTVNLYLTTVTLEAMQGSFKALSGQLGFTPNQITVAGALDSVAAKNLFKTGVVKELSFLDTQPLATLKSNLDKIAPEELTSIFHLGVALSNIYGNNLDHRMEDIRNQAGGGGGIAAAPADGGTRFLGGNNGPRGTRSKEIAPPSNDQWGMFLTGSGEFTHIGSTTNAAGYNLTTGGVTAGIDYRVTGNFAVGLSLGYANTTASLANGGSLDVDGGRVGLYGTWFNQGLHVDASVTGGLNSYKTKRVTPNNTVATGSPNGSELDVKIGAGYDWKFGALTVGPVASYQYTNMRLDGFTEAGAFAPLTIAGNTTESQRSSLGVRAYYDGHIGSKIFRPELRVAWQHEFGATGSSITSNFATLGGTPFTVAGTTVGRDSVLASAGFVIVWNDLLSTFVYYDGQFGQNLQSNNVSGGFRLQF